jgi:hypothetical protein
VFDGIIQESDQLTPIGRRKYTKTERNWNILWHQNGNQNLLVLVL